jgi:hypothetical protein
VNLTNEFHLPEPIEAAVRAMVSDYDRGEVFASVSELCGPTRIAALKRMHGAELTEDVSDMLHMLDGNLIHLLLEKSADRVNAIAEERMVWKVGAYTISGKLDHYAGSETLTINGGTLSDYKRTSVWSAMDCLQNGVKDEWSWQMHGYRLGLWKAKGVVVDKMQNVLFLRDWSKPRARREANMPQHGVVVIDVPITHTIHDTERYFAAKAAALDSALNGGELPLCTETERWQKPTRYAIRKPGNKKATKLFDTRAEADLFLLDKKATEYAVEERPGISTRCAEGYCPVADYCGWWQAQRKEIVTDAEPN